VRWYDPGHFGIIYGDRVHGYLSIHNTGEKNMTLLEQIRENTVILRAVEGVPLLLIGIVLFALGTSLAKKTH